ncbi:hypothetical protein GALMADRAFT_241006 [Galerina marginata CBS 339.88]|uniref:SUZ domain-containing protein n=1 Tax=Galerina marginata (strain CBS 339.88) TaxID=685588 RepID=A0A067TBQ9_GALM3|nr:hypothetical protein GALMADRAFT_241006 [Galerina marginata CBS 339.88]
MALDPSLVVSQSPSSVPRMDHPPHSIHSPPFVAVPPSSSSPPAATAPSPLSRPHHPAQHPDPSLRPSSISPVSDHNGPAPTDDDAAPVSASSTPDVDPQILEALRSKDRIYVLKLGETFEALIMERRTRVELTPATSYQRLLVHRCSAYYRLAPESDPVSKGIFVLSTPESRIPDRRICELIPAESTAHPAFKIMRRSVPERRSKPTSHAGSVVGEDLDLSDVEPSEAGSLGGRSNITSSSNKKRMTIEEREVAYNEARSRIFMDFEEKEKGKDKDMSASSSTLSLNGSASTSAGGRSSISDTDDAASSPATESEWSVPSGSNSRDKKEVRRGGPGSVSASSNRSLRAGGSFHGNNSGGSSRNSRAPSPSFSYASLHDASPSGHVYDPNQQHHNPNMYYPNQYAYPYPHAGQGPTPPFAPQYPYYPAPYNPYQPSPPMPQHNSPDPTTPSGPEPYSPPLQMNYAPHYGWAPHPPPIQSPPPHNMQMSLPPQQPQNPPHSMGPPPPLQAQSPQYQPFIPHGYPYPMNPYYPPPPQPQLPPQMPPPPPHMNMHPQQQQQHPGYDVPRSMNGAQMGNAPNGHFNHNHNGTGPRNGLGNGVIPPNNNGRTNTNSRNGVGPGMNLNNGSANGNGVNGGKQRAQMPPSARSAWSYGPGVGHGGFTSASGMASGNGNSGESVGPRFQSHTHGQRHPSGNGSSGSGGHRSSSHSDEVSSTSSSTTSSSSRRTFTSTTSSQQHPLPARPDWAVGLKAQPTLAASGNGSRHHDHTLTSSGSRGMSPISPPRSHGHGHSPNGNSPSHHQHHQHQHAPPLSLQAMDFPPLGGAVPEKRTPVVSGAWGQSRPTLSMSANGVVGNGNGGTPIGSAQQSPVSSSRLQDEKLGDVFSPKLVRRPPPGPIPVVNGQGQDHQRAQSDRERGKEVAAAGPVAALVGQVSSLSLGEDTGVDASVPTAAAATTANPVNGIAPPFSASGHPPLSPPSAVAVNVVASAPPV